MKRPHLPPVPNVPMLRIGLGIVAVRPDLVVGPAFGS